MDYIIGCMCDICENGNDSGFCKIMLLPLIRSDRFGNKFCECGGFVEKDK